MKPAKRIFIAFLTATMAFQSIAPSTQALALELDAISPIAASQSNDADDQAVVGTSTDPQDDSADSGTDVTIGAEDAETPDGSNEAQDGASSVGGNADVDADASAFGDSATDTAQDQVSEEGADKTTEQADQSASAQATAAPTITTAEQLKAAIVNDGGTSYGTVTVEGDKVTAVSCNDASALILISNADPQIYQNATITKGGITGSGLDLSSAIDGYDFLGFGSSAYPFKGSLNLDDVPISVARTLYNAIELSDANCNIAVTWKGTGSDPIVAGEVTGNGKTLNASVKIDNPVNAEGIKEDTVGITGSLLGSVKGDLSLEASYSFSGTRKGIGIKVTAANANAGLLVNTLEAGTLTLKSLSGIDGAKGTPTVSATGEGGCAGGLIGAVDDGASVVVESPIDVSSLTVAAKDSAGGFIGKAMKLDLSFGDDASIKPAKKVGDANTTYAGGAIGSASFAEGFTLEPGQIDFGDNTLELGATKRAGGLFGRLDVTNGDVTVQGGTYKSKLSAGTDNNSGDTKKRGSYGGLVGNVYATEKAAGNGLRAFYVGATTDDSVTVEFEQTLGLGQKSALCYAGGIAGYVGDKSESTQPVAIVLNGASISCKGAASALNENGRFGGAVGVLDMYDVLDIRNLAVSSENSIGGSSQARSGGVVGSAWIATIKFSGVTDLTNAKFADNDTTGQLVYENYNSLIFADGNGSNGAIQDGAATGWTLKRPSQAVTIDDLATYGEVIRLGNSLSSSLLTLDSRTHVLSDSGLLSAGTAGYTLTSADDFAKLAITWQTNGFYSLVSGISHTEDDTKNGLGTLTSSTITVSPSNESKTIDLAGTGLTGLTKDRAPTANMWDGGIEVNHYFSGTLMGSGAINLAVGEPYGMRNDASIGSDDTSDGNGKIYRHQRLGLFSAVTSGAKTSGGVTIGGTMRFENKADIDAGSLAAQVVGAGDVTVSDATFSTAIIFDSANAGKVLNVGGIFGSVADACTITLGERAKSQATISTATNAADIRVGEAAGYVAGDKAATINITGLEVGGSVETGVSGKANSKALVGGLIGFIQQGSEKKNVAITGLVYNEFSMTVSGENGDPRHGAGGLLGYSWGNSIVTIGDDANNSDGTYALTTNNSSVTADNATEFGGLLYVMSGHLILQNHALDLSGAALSATSATSFGVLLARGAKEQSAETFGGEGSSATYTGLYLEDKTPWDDAYKVADGDKKLQISAKNDIKYFDEWIANVTKKVDENGKETPNDNDWNAIVSLHTQADTLDMSGDSSKDNSYQNRTEFGKLHKTNSMTRYYYNLDRCWEKAGSVFNSVPYSLSTPEALVIWSVCCYAPAEVYAYIGPSNFNRGNTVVIGGANGSPNTIDLTGYSYYPTNDTCKIDIKNTTITFAYSKIKAEQANNKSNASATQHQNMHLSLIRAYSGSSSSTLSVKDVTLAGSTGIAVNDVSSSSGTSVSGALVCRSAYGSGTSPVTTISIDGLKLDGLVIDGADGKDAKGNPKVAPLLINDLTKCVTLNVKNLSASNYSKDGSTVTAASSLFGNLGGSNTANTLVNASFSNNVSVPSEKGNTIFTRASFFESFGYGANQSGSANYVFNENEDKTYGAEIDSQGEYANKQLWYYDAAGYGDVSGPGLVSDGDITASSTDPKYGNKYLPYVKLGKNGTCYHEIKVNQRAANLVVGCGTYSDPYSVRTANELYALTNYINDQNSAVDEWQVTITANQNSICTRRQDNAATNEATYQYSVATGKWTRTSGQSTASGELTNDVMHRYLQSAYYSIEPADDSNEIEADANSFNGFGSLANPFRGVIVGDLKDPSGDTISTVNIKLADDGSSNKKASLGLIPYSYGSVVRKLNVTYSGGTNQIAYANKDTNSGTPGAFFGGVIGCIMGGDNIIDGASVSGGSVASSGDKAHLVPIGGYVGAICGGGVIFRNMGSSNNWRSATKDNGTLYNNPYVGRVVDGYAFSEGCYIDNGNANYQVNQLDTSDTNCITTSDTYMAYSWLNHDGAATVSVADKQGLLLLSAIINSGAAAGAAHTNVSGAGKGTYRGSRAYEGCSFTPSDLNNKAYLFGNEQYGKVRNASYADVGKPQNGTNDAEKAKNDDQKAPGNQNWQGPLDGTDAQNADGEINSPYLVSKYANWATGYICATGITGIRLQFAANGNYDMTGYGSAYQGLSGRYYSNACVTADGINERKYITPLIACIDGNGASITANNKFKEYTDDDYRVSGIGALFNNIAFTSASYVESTISGNGDAQVRDLTFSNCKLSMSYIDKGGNVQTKQDGDTAQVGVGCLAGVTSNLNSQVNQGVYRNVVIDGCTVTGGANAGGLIGSVGYMGLASDKNSRMVVSAGRYADAAQAPVKLVDCLYKNSAISAEASAGGFVGKLQTTLFSVDVNTANQSGEERVAGESANLVGLNSTVRGTSVWNANNEACTVGGLLGLTAAQTIIGNNSYSENPVSLKNVVVTTDSLGSNTFVNTRGLGGVVGRAENSVSVKHVSIESTTDASADSPKYLGSTNASRQSSVRYMYVGGMVGYGAEDASFDDCNVSRMRLAAYECSGGLMGMIANGKILTANDVRIDAVQVDSAYSGGVLGQAGGTGNTIVASNSSVSNSVFKNKECNWKQHPDGAHTYSGGIVGDAKGTIRLSNILVSKNGFEDKAHQGQLFGDVASGDINGIFASGIDVQLTEGETNNDVPGLMHYRTAGDAPATNKKCFFAFADYNDALNEIDGSTLYNDERADDGSMPAVSSASPCVTTNPVSTLAVKASAGSDSKFVFGDGAGILTAGTILDEHGTSGNGRYTYTNIGGRNEAGEYQNSNSYDKGSQSTFNACNTGVDAKKVPNDFNVLVISGNDTETVTNYLDLVTNGGFTDAVRLNESAQQYVTAKAEMFKLDEDGSLVKSDEKPSLAVVSNGENDMYFRASTSWDNDQSRFTLLTVTFNDGANHTYKVQVPIVVKRMLEINFAATYTYDTNYKSSNYDAIDSSTGHVLTSAGDAMTGYLTWTYNKALDKETQYGLETHLEGGGSLKPIDKTIVFDGTDDKGTLPAGAQLTLVDKALNDRQYHYTVTDEDTSGSTTNIPLTKFEDASGSSYKGQWLSELMDVTVGQDNSGAWVRMDNPSDEEIDQKAVAKVGGYYYRLVADGEQVPALSRYKLSLTNEGARSESFYLVVRLPQGTTKNVNGFTTTTVSSGMNTHVNCVLRNNPSENDSHVNTASTYSIASSYGQSLTDNRRNMVAQMSIAEGDSVYRNLQLDVSDAITLGSNEYNSNDSLYYKLDSSLANFENSGDAGAVGYPRGAQIDYKYYVNVGGNYYKYENGNWVDKGTSEVAATEGSAVADGNDLSLTLADAGGNALDLREIRKIAKSLGGFSIQLKANVVMTDPQCQAAIMASTDKGQTSYTKPTYRSFLSVHPDTLATSSMTADCDGNVKYYRQGVGSSTISLMATKKTQLGINVDDLGSADGTIALVGTYDFTNLRDADSLLSKADTVTYTLSLQRRNDDGSYETLNNNIGQYITVKETDHLGTGTVSADGSSIVFTDTKGANGFATREGTSLALKHRFVVQVNTDVEGKSQWYESQWYDNYRIVLTARLSGNGVSNTPVNEEGIADYPSSDYVTYTLTKVNTEGIPHS